MQQWEQRSAKDDDGVCLTAVQGQMPPAAVHGLARQLAARIDAGLDAPLCASRVVLMGDGTVHLKGGRVSKRWRAPELRSDDDDGMARTIAGDRWCLGRLLLELALGNPVPDSVVDDAGVERLQGLKDVERRALPPSLIVMLAELLERHPEGRSYVDASDNADGVEVRALARFVALERVSQPSRPRQPPLSRAAADTKALQRMAREMSGKVSLKSLEGERTGDMPAGAILGRDDLMRLGMPRAPLPTQALPALWARPPRQSPTPAPRPFDEVEVTVPTEIAALMAPEPQAVPVSMPTSSLPPLTARGPDVGLPPVPQPTPSWIATVRIEPPPPSSKATRASTSSSSQMKKPSTKTHSPDAQTTKSTPVTTTNSAPKKRSWSKKKYPRALLAAATLALALLGAAVGVHQTDKMSAPAEPLIFSP